MLASDPLPHVLRDPAARARSARAPRRGGFIPMKGLPGRLFAAGSALPLRLRTAAFLSNKPGAACAAARGIVESARAAPLASRGDACDGPCAHC